MSDEKILIIYGSWLGSTQEVAERIGEVFKTEGAASVAVLTGDEIQEVQSYDAVLIGSGVQGGVLSPEMTRPVKRFEHELAQKPMAGFLLCMTMMFKRAANAEANSRSFMEKFLKTAPAIHLQEIKPLKGAFLIKNAPTGGIRFGGWLMSLMVGRDQREWQVIDDWARSVYHTLTNSITKP